MKNVWATTGCVSLRLDKIKEHESSTDHINSVAIEALCIKVPFFSQRLCIKVPFSEVAPCPFEILARTLVYYVRDLIFVQQKMHMDISASVQKLYLSTFVLFRNVCFLFLILE